MKQLSTPWDGTCAAKRPLELIITTTLLNGARTVTSDSLGQLLPQMLHQGHFTFRREGHCLEDECHCGEAETSTVDDFAPSAHCDIAVGLAIASRCTASFPVAFEPCYVPAVGQAGQPLPAGPALVDLTDPSRRPDLGAHVSWRRAGPAQAVPEDRSRYAVDGGVLANTPTKVALEALSRLPASGLVQRVMLLVYPHAPVNQPDPADDVNEPPTVTGAMGGLLGALLSQGSRTFVDEIETHNQAAAARRGTRLDIMGGLLDPDDPNGPDAPARLRGLADAVFKQYRNQRIRRAARDLAGRVEPPVELVVPAHPEGRRVGPARLGRTSLRSRGSAWGVRRPNAPLGLGYHHGARPGRCGAGPSSPADQREIRTRGLREAGQRPPDGERGQGRTPGPSREARRAMDHRSGDDRTAARQQAVGAALGALCAGDDE